MKRAEFVETIKLIRFLRAKAKDEKAQRLADELEILLTMVPK